MDKLKIIKTVVCVLTFIVVFLLCFAVSKVISRVNHSQSFNITVFDTQIREISSSNDYLYILGRESIHVINTSEHRLVGEISLNKEKRDSIKKEKE